MVDRSNSVAIRLADLRAGLQMTLAERLARFAEAMERLSNALHARAMADYWVVLAAVDADERRQH